MAEEKYIHHELRDEGSVKGKLYSSLREVVFGLEDGIVSTLGAITGIAAGTQDIFIVILSGFVIIFVESLSMAAGTYLSSKSEHEVEERMLKEEAQEIEYKPEQETDELVHIYREKGFSEKEIDILVKRITSDKKLWLEEMAFHELHIIPSRERAPKGDALIMGFSYILGGFVPLSMYFFLSIEIAAIASISFSVVALFLIGFTKGKLVRTNSVRSGIEMAVVSLSAAALGFIVGRVISTYFGV